MNKRNIRNIRKDTVYVTMRDYLHINDIEHSKISNNRINRRRSISLFGTIKDKMIEFAVTNAETEIRNINGNTLFFTKKVMDIQKHSFYTKMKNPLPLLHNAKDDIKTISRIFTGGIDFE